MIRLPPAAALNPVPKVEAGLRWLRTPQDRRQRRHTLTAGGHAHIELRGAHLSRNSPLAADAKRALEGLEGVEWAEVDGVVGRVIIAFDPDSIGTDDLIHTIETVEKLHGVADEPFPRDRPDHPADREPMRANLAAIGADVAGVGVAAVAQSLHLVRLPSEIPGVLTLLDTQPRVRRLLDTRLRRPAADIVVASTTALAQALGQGPLGLVVDIAHRTGLVQEQRARRMAWDDREPELVQGPHTVGHPAEELPARPRTVPPGPIERYSDGAAVASLGVIGIVLGLTRDPRRASGMLLTGIPKAATLGREAFGAQLDALLAGHGVITMDAAALRRLDRVDALLLEADVVMSDDWTINEVVAFGLDADLVQCTVRARELFEPRQPLATRSRRAWTLAPLTLVGRTLPRGAKSRGRLLGAGGRKVLGLWHGDELHALVSLHPEPAPLVDELVGAARSADLEVRLVGGTTAFANRLGVDQPSPASHAVTEIVALQGEGHVVMYVGTRQTGALRTADIGLGVERDGHRVPWGADLVVGSGLDDAWRIVDAIAAAREVSRRSALLALAGASTGGVWAIAGPGRTAAQRALIPINAAALVSIGLGRLAGLQAANRSIPRRASSEPWHEMSRYSALDRLETSTEGLGATERTRRRSRSAARIVYEPIGLIRASLEEIVNPLTPLLAIGATLSAAVGSMTDAGLVGGVVVVNALVGGAQRVQTDRSLHDLEEHGDVPVRVRVAGELAELASEDLVIGDVIELEAGELVPGDCRLLEAIALEVDESGITGESLPVTKSVSATPGAPVPEQTSMLFEGTSIVAGRAVALVVAVGHDTEAGRSAAAATAPPPTGVERRLERLTRLTMPASFVGGAAVTALGFLYRRPARTSISTGVSLMVAAVPEGLPALATLAQVMSARRLAANQALVRNPRAIEAIGRVDQVCFDKTGTLTQGAISLVLVSNDRHEEPIASLTDVGRSILAAAARATPSGDSDEDLPNATDRAIVAGAVGAGVADADEMTGWHRVDELPFESRRGYHVVVGRDHTTGSLVSVKGAPDVVIPRCTSWRRCGKRVPIDTGALRAIDEEVERLGRRGLRVLAVAEATAPDGPLDLADAPDGLELRGFIGLADAVRPTAAAALRNLTSAGVRVAMITGDHASTAEAIAAQLGMLDGGRVLGGPDLDQLSPDELDDVIGEVAVFARVTPIQKARIVEAYQRIGRSVAMTGDGANDAAAIRLADAGIALGGRGTAAARQVADIIIVDDRIETIVDAVVEGRAMWESVRAAVAILVGGNLGEVGFTVLGSVLTGAAPLNARQLLLVNLLTDMAPALAIAMREPPDRTPERLLHEGPDASLGEALVREIAVRAGATAAGAAMAWGVARATGTPTRARTVALAGLVGAQLGQTLVAGGRSPLVLGATAVSVAALVGIVQTPGVSQFFGCRPLGPVGWTTAVTTSAAATGASVVLPRALEHIGHRIVRRQATAPVVELPTGRAGSVLAEFGSEDPGPGTAANNREPSFIGRTRLAMTGGTTDVTTGTLTRRLE